MKAKVVTVATILLLFISNCYLTAYANEPLFDEKTNTLTTGYYVVVGAYSINKESYAQRYASVVKEKGYNAAYGFSRKKNLYFVYINSTGNYKESLAEMREARKTTDFSEAWVFVCLDAGEESVSENTTVNRDPEPVKGQIKPIETPIEKIKEAPIVDEEKSPEKEVSIEKIIDKRAETFKINTLSDASVFFNLYNAQNNKDVLGEVQIVDAERAKLVDVVKSGNYVTIEDPKNGTGKIALIVDVFGYRRGQFELNYYNPEIDIAKENVERLADILLVNFELVRYHVGDIVTMYNVYFFKDAAIMRPESKFEVNSLLTMLQENEDYKIKIHGHVNGKHPGKIISRGDSKTFFALNDFNKEGFGSAKELSLRRAELIKEYLVEQGIRADRMEIKAWGGKRMIHDKHSNKAKENVRVEIEILEE
ncbi:MAG: OmpA family protein [Bacteroidota bacterium]